MRTYDGIEEGEADPKTGKVKESDQIRDKREARERACAAAASHVAKELGRPKGFLRVAVTQVDHGCFRANVLVQNDEKVQLSGFHNVSISDSFWLRACKDGYISCPPLARKYGKPKTAEQHADMPVGSIKE